MGLYLLIILVVPIILILLVSWLLSGTKYFVRLIVLYSIVIATLLTVVYIIGIFTNKKEINRDDLYGSYVIDRTHYPGKQSDWQYNHFRFDITKQQQFLFYQIEKEKILRIYTGKIRFVEGYSSPRIVLQFDEPKHHILEEKPTLYRKIWSFYYTFYSKKFGNVFFTKGEWKPID